MAEKLIITCRPARQADIDGMMEITRTIWEGHDYVPKVWGDWLKDPHGLLAVAEHEGRVLGLGKLTRVTDEDWWLEGMRVHPEYEGRGIASQLHNYLVDHWLHTGSGTVRLMTISTRIAVHRMCERLGFEKIFECTSFVAPAIQAEQSKAQQANTTSPEGFRPLEMYEADQAAAFAESSSLLQYSQGLIDLGWQWAPPLPDHFRAGIERGRAWWWRERQGLLMLMDDTDDEGLPLLWAQAIVCSIENLCDCLIDYRRLGGKLDFQRVGWTPSLHPNLLPELEAAGFQRDWEDTLYLFAKRHPAC